MTQIDAVVFVDEPVEGWPSNYRRLNRHIHCPLSDLELQWLAPGEVVFVTETGGDPRLHAVALDPYPKVVPIPLGP